MSKRAAIAKAAGFNVGDSPNEHPLLGEQRVVALAKDLADAIGSASTSKRARPSRSGCAQSALQILVVAAGLRRAALVDSIGLTVEQASAISLKLALLGKEASTADLQGVRLLFHAPTLQTFIVSRRGGLWTDVAGLQDTSGSGDDHSLWVDVRSTPQHNSPTVSRPDAHVSNLLISIRRAVLEDASHDVLVVSQSPSDRTSASYENGAQLVGVTLAGFLLEYGAIYCIHDPPSIDTVGQHNYDVQPLRSMDRTPMEPDFAVSPANCLGTHSLLLFKIVWLDEAERSLELLSFSMPRYLITDEEAERRRVSLVDIFQGRVESVSRTSLFAGGRIVADVSAVTLNQVLL